jgi:murein DD-endopeptidase MepM/ murein hydrolase activator NlpD
LPTRPRILLTSAAVVSALPLALGLARGQAAGSAAAAVTASHPVQLISAAGGSTGATAIGSPVPLPLPPPPVPAYIPVVPLPYVDQLVPSARPLDPRDPEQWVDPIVGHAISPFGRRDGGERHDGLDIKGADHAPITASFPGRVVQAGPGQSGYGISVTVDVGDGLTVLYAHLSAVTVHAGEEVAAGQQVGVEGQTGRATTAHLHYEIRDHGRPISPVPYLD